MGAGSTFTLNVYPEPFKRRAPSLAGALSPPERVRPARQNDRQMRALRFGIVFYLVCFLGTILLAAARVPSVVFRFAVMALLLGFACLARRQEFRLQPAAAIWLWGVILPPADSAFLALSCIFRWRGPLPQVCWRWASLLSRAELLVSAKWGRPKCCGRRFSLKLHLNYVRMKNPSLQPATCVLWCLLLITALGPGMVEAFAQSPRAAATIGPIQLSDQPEIDAGFRLLYELKFAEARATFAGWGSRHPGEALGPAVEAASYLFQEFDRQNALSSEFFLDDDRLLGGVKGTPDPKVRDAFGAAVREARELARARLKSNPHDADALFALTIATGMQADYASLIERRQMESLRLTREADKVAKDLLAVAPGAADAYVALGAANYITGCLPGYKRFVIRFGGFHGDRALGMKQLGLAAANGHYLRPFAKLTLALAAMREKQWGLARTQLEQLTAEFPANPKFARELAKLKDTIGPATGNH